MTFMHTKYVHTVPPGSKPVLEKLWVEVLDALSLIGKHYPHYIYESGIIFSVHGVGIRYDLGTEKYLVWVSDSEERCVAWSFAITNNKVIITAGDITKAVQIAVSLIEIKKARASYLTRSSPPRMSNV
jgi:hypothetical protein